MDDFIAADRDASAILFLKDDFTRILVEFPCSHGYVPDLQVKLFGRKVGFRITFLCPHPECAPYGLLMRQAAARALKRHESYLAGCDIFLPDDLEKML